MSISNLSEILIKKKSIDEIKKYIQQQEITRQLSSLNIDPG